MTPEEKEKATAAKFASFNHFRDMVARMRAAQKRYFKDKRRSDLELSKKLEREVDEELAQNQTTGLFS